jgi:hypothetical protein
MCGALFLAALALSGVDVGWQPLPGGGVEYKIQLTPETLEALLVEVAELALGPKLKEKLLTAGYETAQAIVEAKDSTSASLASYEEKLSRSFVVKEMHRHGAIQKMMNKRHIFEVYPRIMVDAARMLYEFDEASPKLLEAGRRSMKGRRSTIGVLSDLLALARGP